MTKTKQQTSTHASNQANPLRDLISTRSLLFALIVTNVAFLIYWRNNTCKKSKPSLQTPVLHVFDHITDTRTLPSQFRTSDELLEIANQQNITSHGLEGLNIAGGQQFSVAQFNAVKDRLPHLAIVVDLRQECHHFLNDLPVSWYGQGNAANLYKTPEQIQKEEKKLRKSLKPSSVVEVSHVLKESSSGSVIGLNTTRVVVHNTSDERHVVQHVNNITYQRFYITDHHGPSVTEVDRFVEFVLQWNRTHPVSTSRPYIYFHCRGGFGRTTSFMSMV
jgi:hypothetical protein